MLTDFSSWEESWEDYSVCQHLHFQDRATATSRCPNCGRGPHAKSACPANGRKCNGCKGRGDFAAFCPKNKKSPSGSDKMIDQLKLRQAASPATLQATLDVSTRLNTESSSTVLAWVPDTGSDVDAIGLNHISSCLSELFTTEDRACSRQLQWLWKCCRCARTECARAFFFLFFLPVYILQGWPDS